MKKLFTMLCLWALSCVAFSAMAQDGSSPFVGVAPGNYDEVYLYNVDTGTWLQDNDFDTTTWTSFAQVGPRGRDMQLVSENGGYRINPKMGSAHGIRYDLWMDTDTATDWTFTLIDGTTDQYTITYSNYKLGVNSSGTLVSSSPTYDAWQIVTRESRIAYDEKTATADNPADMTWIVLGGTFAASDEHIGVNWLGTYDNSFWNLYGDVSQSGLYCCSKVWELCDYPSHDVYQDINDLPNGKYIVNADVVYSSGTDSHIDASHYNAYLDGSEPTCGYFYANDKTVGVTNLYDLVADAYSARNTEEVGNGKWAPRYTPEVAAHMFDGEARTDDIQLDITDGKLRVGVKAVDGLSTTWLLMDNFRVYYYGASTDESAITEGKYYLYNVGTGTWLGDNFTNTAKNTLYAELSERGREFTITSVDGGYQLNANMGGNLNASDLDLTATSTIGAWTFELVDGTTDQYLIKCGNYQLGADASGLATSTASNVVNGEWKLITRDERLESECAEATEDNPADLSWLILGGTFPAADGYRTDGTWLGAPTSSNAVGGNGTYSCSTIWEMWDITERNTYQEIEGLPNGKYVVNAYAVFSPTAGSDSRGHDYQMDYQHYLAYLDGTEPTLGSVYANNESTPMVNAYAMATTEQVTTYNTKQLTDKDTGEGMGIWVPNGTSGFSNNFFDDKGGKVDDIIVNVTDGTLKVGVKVEGSALPTAWILFDTFHLYYYGPESYAGAEPSEGDYYLYNVGTGTWLGDNFTNTAKNTLYAELSDRGREFTITAIDGGWQLDPHMEGDNFLNASDLNLNAEGSASAWTFELVDGTNDQYYIKSGTYQLGADASGLATSTASNVVNGEWKLITRDDRLKFECAEASEDNPVDLSWLILGGTFPNKDDYRSDGTWQGVPTSNNGHSGNSTYQCSTVWEIWAISSLNTYQDIEDLPNGKYVVNAYAAFSPTAYTDDRGHNYHMDYQHYLAYLDGSEPTLGSVYANNESTLMVNCYEMATTEQVAKYNTYELFDDETGAGMGIWVPGGTSSFSANFFDDVAGKVDDIPVNVTDGTLRVGVKVEGSELATAWIIFDTFHLYYYGEEVEEEPGPEIPDEGDDNYVGSAVGEGNFYLLNVGTGKWLGDNYTNTSNDSSYGELSVRGREFEFTALNDGWQLNPKMGGSHYLRAVDLSLTGTGEASEWDFELVDETENLYYITCGKYKLGADVDGLATTASSMVTYGKWKLVKREDRLACEAAEATKENPADMSWVVLGGTFPVTDDYRTDGTWKGVPDGDYANGGNGTYVCANLWEMWAISNCDVYQEIEDLPNGSYTVTANAIYVSTASTDGRGHDYQMDYQHYLAYLDGSEPTLGYVYANDTYTPMVNVYSLTTTESTPPTNTKELTDKDSGAGMGVWVPSGTSEYSNIFFLGGGLVDDININITDGKLRTGVLVEDAPGTAWILFDNFYVYYNGEASEDPGTPTGITEVEGATDSASEAVYNLQGQKLAAPVKGVNIINGKKVLVK